MNADSNKAVIFWSVLALGCCWVCLLLCCLAVTLLSMWMQQLAGY